MKYIAFYVKPGQGFLFPQEVLWLNNGLAKRPTLDEYEEIKNTKQIFVGSVEYNGKDILGWEKLLVSDLEVVEGVEEYNCVLAD